MILFCSLQDYLIHLLPDHLILFFTTLSSFIAKKKFLKRPALLENFLELSNVTGMNYSDLGESFIWKSNISFHLLPHYLILFLAFITTLSHFIPCQIISFD